MRPSSPSGNDYRPEHGYRRRLTIHAAPQSVFDAIATVDGPRHWWTTMVTGSAQPRGQLTFRFAGLDEQIVMRVDAVEPLTLVRWTCTAHNRDEEWTGTTVRFQLSATTEGNCELDFRHQGLPAERVATGWAHFLTSLGAHSEHGRGTPFGA